MRKLLDLDSSLDLRDFAAFLWRHQVPHRITHFEGGQQLWIGQDVDPAFVLDHFHRWRQGASLKDASRQQPQPDAGPPVWRQAPVTLALILLSLMLSLMTGLGKDEDWLRWFTFVDFRIDGDRLVFQTLGGLLQSGEWWRWLSPLFIHFSLLHIVFNMLWTWELGRRIERLQRSGVLMGLVLVTGISSNLAQYLMSGPLFGGMSGVIFGLMGYTWLWDRLCPERGFGLPPALMTFMLIWLVLGVTGAIEALGFGAIANTAHLVGLVSGLLVTPLIYALRARLWRR